MSKVIYHKIRENILLEWSVYNFVVFFSVPLLWLSSWLFLLLFLREFPQILGSSQTMSHSRS